MDTILLIDFNNAVWRGNVGFVGTVSDKPSFTIVFNFFNQLRTLIEELTPNKIFLCGEGGKSFRKDLLAGYKANRIVKTASKDQALHDDVHRQADIIWELCGSFPLHRANANSFEADDIIATLAENLQDEDVIIVSNDKDFVQLIQRLDNISIFNPFKKEYVEAPDYHQLTFQILNGDAGDDIPSIIGKKAAIAIASKPELLAKFLSNEEHQSQYRLNKQLIELKSIGDESIHILEPVIDYELVLARFREMEFNSILSKWTKWKAPFDNLR